MPLSKFELTPKEVEAAENFLAKLPKKYKNKDTEIIFSSGSGIGIGVKIRVGNREKDITDYDTW